MRSDGLLGCFYCDESSVASKYLCRDREAYGTVCRLSTECYGGDGMVSTCNHAAVYTLRVVVVMERTGRPDL